MNFFSRSDDISSDACNVYLPKMDNNEILLLQDEDDNRIIELDNCHEKESKHTQYEPLSLNSKTKLLR